MDARPQSIVLPSRRYKLKRKPKSNRPKAHDKCFAPSLQMREWLSQHAMLSSLLIFKHTHCILHVVVSGLYADDWPSKTIKRRKENELVPRWAEEAFFPSQLHAFFPLNGAISREVEKPLSHDVKQVKRDGGNNELRSPTDPAAPDGLGQEG